MGEVEYSMPELHHSVGKEKEKEKEKGNRSFLPRIPKHIKEVAYFQQDPTPRHPKPIWRKPRRKSPSLEVPRDFDELVEEKQLTKQRSKSVMRLNPYQIKISLKCSDGIPNKEYKHLANVITKYHPPVKLSELEKKIRQLSKSFYSMQKEREEAKKEEGNKGKQIGGSYSSTTGEEDVLPEIKRPILRQEMTSSPLVMMDDDHHTDQPVMISPFKMKSIRGRAISLKRAQIDLLTEEERQFNSHLNRTTMGQTLTPDKVDDEGVDFSILGRAQGMHDIINNTSKSTLAGIQILNGGGKINRISTANRRLEVRLEHEMMGSKSKLGRLAKDYRKDPFFRPPNYEDSSSSDEEPHPHPKAPSPKTEKQAGEKNIFCFKVDAFNNSIHLRRKATNYRPPERRYKAVKKRGIQRRMSGMLQKRKIVTQMNKAQKDRSGSPLSPTSPSSRLGVRRDSIKVYYNVMTDGSFGEAAGTSDSQEIRLFQSTPGPLTEGSRIGVSKEAPQQLPALSKPTDPFHPPSKSAPNEIQDPKLSSPITKNRNNKQQKLMERHMRDNPVLRSQVMKLMTGGDLSTSFDLTNVPIHKMDPADYVTLFLAMKNAIDYAYSGTQYTDEINLMEPDVAKMILSKRKRKIYNGKPEWDNRLNSLDIEVLKIFQEMQEQIAEGKILQGFWSIKKGSPVKPPCRQGGSMLVVDDRIYLYGGVASERRDDFWYATQTEQFPEKWDWTKLPNRNEDPQAHPEGRFGAALAYKDRNFIMFGGGGEFSKALRTTKAFNDLWVYHLNTSEWYPEEAMGSRPSPRYYTGYCQMDNMLFMHGGFDGSKNLVFPDMYLFDIVNMVWHEIVQTFSGKNSERVPELCMHSAVGVLPKWLTSRKENTDYWSNFHRWAFQDRDPLHCSKVGIYLLGGKNQSDEINTEVWLLKPNSLKTKSFIQLEPSIAKHQYLVDAEKLRIKGSGPLRRFLHSATHFQSYIALFGGRNDQDSSLTNSPARNDLYLLDLDKYAWVRLTTQGFAPSVRWDHCMVVVEDRLLVFGGVNPHKYCSPNIYILETDPNVVLNNLKECKKIKKLIEEEAGKLGIVNETLF